jgi:hypothetical protein
MTTTDLVNLLGGGYAYCQANENGTVGLDVQPYSPGYTSAAVHVTMEQAEARRLGTLLLREAA